MEMHGESETSIPKDQNDQGPRHPGHMGGDTLGCRVGCSGVQIYILDWYSHLSHFWFAPPHSFQSKCQMNVQRFRLEMTSILTIHPVDI